MGGRFLKTFLGEGHIYYPMNCICRVIDLPIFQKN